MSQVDPCYILDLTGGTRIRVPHDPQLLQQCRDVLAKCEAWSGYEAGTDHEIWMKPVIERVAYQNGGEE